MATRGRTSRNATAVHEEATSRATSEHLLFFLFFLFPFASPRSPRKHAAQASTRLGLNANQSLVANEPGGPPHDESADFTRRRCLFCLFVCILAMIPRRLSLSPSQVGPESSHDAQVLLAAGLHGHYPALPRPHQVLWLRTATAPSWFSHCNIATLSQFSFLRL